MQLMNTCTLQPRARCILEGAEWPLMTCTQIHMLSARLPNSQVDGILIGLGPLAGQLPMDSFVSLAIVFSEYVVSKVSRFLCY